MLLVRDYRYTKQLSILINPDIDLLRGVWDNVNVFKKVLYLHTRGEPLFVSFCFHFTWAQSAQVEQLWSLNVSRMSVHSLLTLICIQRTWQFVKMFILMIFWSKCLCWSFLGQVQIWVTLGQKLGYCLKSKENLVNSLNATFWFVVSFEPC